jgi:sigma-B regulation protein RsbU (phosphoserine phosphatase)
MDMRDRSLTPVIDALPPPTAASNSEPARGAAAVGGRVVPAGELECDSRSLGLLLESIAEVTSTIDLERLLVNIVDKSLELTGAERGMLLLPDSRDGTLKVRVARDAEARDLATTARYSTRIVFEVQTTGESICTLMSSDEEALRVSHSVYNMGIRAVMCTPLLVGDRSMGLIYVDSRLIRREFSPADLALFEALSRQIAIALSNAQLVQESLQKTRLEQSLQIAADIQARLLPDRAPEVPGLEVHGWHLPCEIASGDYYDFLALPGGRLAVVIGDVSGHGIGAALITATARATLRAYLRAVPVLSDAVNRLNRDLAGDLTDEMFMTLFVAVVDPQAGLLHYVNAGHPPAQLVRSAGADEQLEATGMALGIVPDEQYATAPVELRPGDLLFGYTDGISEARGAAGQMFGERRLSRVIRQLRNQSCAEIVADVARVVELYQRESPSDDRTAFALKYLERAGSPTRRGVRAIYG